MTRARVREPVFTSLDVVRVAMCACEKRAASIRRYCESLGERAENYWYCRGDVEVNWFSKTEYALCLRELGYRVKWETAFRKLRKEAERGEYITYLNGKGGTYKLLVKLVEVR